MLGLDDERAKLEVLLDRLHAHDVEYETRLRERGRERRTRGRVEHAQVTHEGALLPARVAQAQITTRRAPRKRTHELDRRLAPHVDDPKPPVTPPLDEASDAPRARPFSIDGDVRRHGAEGERRAVFKLH